MTSPVSRLSALAIRATDLEIEARRYARLAAEVAEDRIAALASDAIAARRIDEAVFWQRVKFRARLLRALGNT